MIKLQNYTPEVYYKHSRDFQFIGRLYDVVLNSIKTNVDTIYNMPFSDNFNTKLADLLAMTLGFKPKHPYNVKQLIALCSSFAEILRNKGNITSIEMACEALANAEGIREPISYLLDEENCHIDFFVPEALSDVNLLKDLLEYILPAGMTYSIIRTTLWKTYGTTGVVVGQAVNYTRSPVRDMETSIYVSELSKNRKWRLLPGQNPGWITNTTVVNPLNEYIADNPIDRPEISIEGNNLTIEYADKADKNEIYIDNNFVEKIEETENEQT